MSNSGHVRGDPGFITPGSDAHSKTITASKVASILGVSRFESAYSLYYRMRGEIEAEPPKDIYRVGHAFEMALAELWKLDNPGWKLSRSEVQFSTDQFGFPAMATVDRRAVRGRQRRLIEFKITHDLGEWGDPNLSGDLPMDYVTQVIFQQMVSGIHSTADVLLMAPWFKHITYRVDYDQVIADWIVRECSKFWTALHQGIPPELDDSVSTYSCVKELHPDIDGSEVEVPEDLIADIRECNSAVGELQDRQRGLKTQLLSLMGNAQTAHINGEVVARRQRHGKGGTALKMCG